MRPLSLAGFATLLLALLHVAIPIGGPRWYAFFGAPERLVDLAAIGNPRAAGTCVIVAVALLCCAAYAFSGAGMIRRLPFLRGALLCIGAVFTLRGIAFPVVAALQPAKLVPYCGNCATLNEFVLTTSAVALVIGGIYLAEGARLSSKRSQLSARAVR